MNANPVPPSGESIPVGESIPGDSIPDESKSGDSITGVSIPGEGVRAGSPLPSIDDLKAGVDLAKWRDHNHANWEARVPIHVGPGGYEIERFVDEPDHLSDVVAFDLPRLGDVKGKRAVHLQCHIGTDTLSLARLGAEMTGLDFSGSALVAARDLAARTGANIDYVESDVYDAVEALGKGRFDLVYTGVGAISWLDSIERWAHVVSELLVDGGELFIRDTHPMLCALDDERVAGEMVVAYPYMNDGGTVFVETESYAGEGQIDAEASTIVDFSHGLAEIFNALWNEGMTVTLFEEHTSVPWRAFGDLMEPIGGGEYAIKDRPNRVAMSFTIRATKTGSTRLPI